MRKEAGEIDYWSNDACRVLPPLLLSEQEAAEMLGISARNLFDLQKRGEVVARQLGNRKLYHIDEVRRYAATLPLYPIDKANNHTEE